MKTTKHTSGFTLIEIAISILIVMVLVAGAMGYQYHCARDVRVSEIQATAARISMLLLEGWKGDEGAADFDPVAAFDSEITLSTSATGPAVPTGRDAMSLTLLGHYEIQMDPVYYYVTLSWSAATSLEPKVLNVTTGWRRDYEQGVLEGNEPCVQYSTFYVTN